MGTSVCQRRVWYGLLALTIIVTITISKQLVPSLLEL